jgi:hypothetical protein
MLLIGWVWEGRRLPKRFRTRAYAVNVEPGASVVKGPYVAETIKVAVESDYVVDL